MDEVVIVAIAVVDGDAIVLLGMLVLLLLSFCLLWMLLLLLLQFLCGSLMSIVVGVFCCHLLQEKEGAGGAGHKLEAAHQGHAFLRLALPHQQQQAQATGEHAKTTDAFCFVVILIKT